MSMTPKEEKKCNGHGQAGYCPNGHCLITHKEENNCCCEISSYAEPPNNIKTCHHCPTHGEFSVSQVNVYRSGYHKPVSQEKEEKLDCGCIVHLIPGKSAAVAHICQKEPIHHQRFRQRFLQFSARENEGNRFVRAYTKDVLAFIDEVVAKAYEAGRQEIRLREKECFENGQKKERTAFVEKVEGMTTSQVVVKDDLLIYLRNEI